MSKVAIFLADGFEEIEGLTVVDLLRRANIGIDMISITGSEKVCGSHNIEIKADLLIEAANLSEYDMIVLPGGMPGTKNLAKHEGVKAAILSFKEAGKKLAAICAAPTVYGEMGLLKDKTACCYGGMEDGLKGANVSFDNVCVDGQFITSRGMGTAIEFGLKIVETFEGKEVADKLSDAIMIKK